MTRRRTKRRVTNAAVLAVGVAALWWVVQAMDARLVCAPYWTGYALLAVLVVLAVYNARKKFASLPLGSGAAWLQLHLYLGAGSAVLLLVHTGGRWPNGWLEGFLAAVYWLTFVSGVVGLYLTRAIPRQLARTSEEFVYERIPRLRREVLAKSRSVVLQAAGDAGATTLADFYTSRIDPYLAESRGGVYTMRPSSSMRRALMRELADLKRFLDQAELVASEKLFALVRKKDDLDFHESRQSLLKRWLFVHITLTCLVLVASVAHGLLALSMRGGPG
ncbi:MAG: hypothetical protein AAGB00_03870 [Planctomycetota bacterium]